MTKSVITYPQYRKYGNNKSFFKIISPIKFEEIQVFGETISLHIFDAKILPDRNYIYDLTFNYKENWVGINPEEYENLKMTITSL